MSGLNALYFLNPESWIVAGMDLREITAYGEQKSAGCCVDVADYYQASNTDAVLDATLSSALTISDPLVVKIVLEDTDNTSFQIDLISGGTTQYSKTFSNSAGNAAYFFLLNSERDTITFDEVKISFFGGSYAPYFYTNSACPGNGVSGVTVDGTAYNDTIFWLGTFSGFAVTENSKIMQLGIYDADIANFPGYRTFLTNSVLGTQGNNALVHASNDIDFCNYLSQDTAPYPDDEMKKISAALSSTKNLLLIYPKATAAGQFRVFDAKSYFDLQLNLVDGISEKGRYEEKKLYTDDRYLFKYIRSKWLELGFDIGYLTQSDKETLRSNLDLAKQGTYNLAVIWETLFYFMEIKGDMDFNYKNWLYRIKIDIEEKTV